MTVTIWHNQRCGNSRGALAHIRAAGIKPVIRDYRPPEKVLALL